MGGELDHAKAEEALVPYVLRALEPHEEAAVREHLELCDECAQDTRSLARVVRWLGLGTQPLPPPPGFLEGVLARIRAERLEEAPSAPRRALVPALAALVILFAAVAGWSFFRAEQAEREGATDRRVAADLAAAEDGIALTGAGEAGGRIIPIEGGSRMVAAGLIHPGSGNTYQLWLVREDGDIESAGTFSVAGGLAVLTLSESMVTFRSALVTIEPEGGSPQPTTDAVIAGPDL